MLAEAERKADSAGGGRPAGARSSLQELALGRRFDAALMLFAVLGYQLTNADVSAALALRAPPGPGGLVVFDHWYGPQCSRPGRPRAREEVETHGGRIVRSSSGRLETRRHLLHVVFQVQRWTDDRLVEQVEERHSVRYFFLELELFLESAAPAASARRVSNLDQDAGDATWSALGVARAL